MSLKTKLLSGFIAVVILTAVLAAVVVWLNAGNSRLARAQDAIYTPEGRLAYNLSIAIFSAGYNFRAYQYTYDENLYKTGVSFLDEMDRARDGLRTAIEKYGEYLPTLSKDWDGLNLGLREYRELNAKIHTRILRLIPLQAELEEAGELVVSQLANYYAGYRALAAAETAKGDKGALTRRFDRYVLGLEQIRQVGELCLKTAKSLDVALSPEDRAASFAEAENIMKAIQETMRNTLATTSLPEWQAKASAVVAATAKWKDVCDAVIQLTGEISQLSADRVKRYRELGATARRVSDAGFGNIETSARETNDKSRLALWVSVILGALAVVVGLVMSFGISRSVSSTLGRIIDVIGPAGAAVYETSHYMSGSSAKLADDAAQQASNLEETAAAIAHMASMTRQNADNSQKTAEITASTLKLVQDENDAMRNMTTAMADINEQSDKIRRIIKSIESIAFQT
ncbi:MAG: hypothetical protein LBV15_03775, partial [Planctomycetota bacterium]|nr:hypothetical protein [Planctomycetota bacterium]